ncbi:MAG: TetR family transcriptional regulator [Hyphomonadaceae bacterium]|nr:TetR family transcriptional regulator [Hyphomonadaceae bacterium]
MAQDRPKDRAATEAAILEAARAILAEHGFAALNVSAVAEAARVDRKLIYRYFGGVDGLAARLGGAESSWTGAAPLPRTSRADAFDAYAKALRADPALQQMLAWELVETSPTLRKLDAARSAAMKKSFAGLNAGAASEDSAAENAVALAALHYLALRERTLGGFAGLKLDKDGWRRVHAVLGKLLRDR